jgi:hypothetical protein
MEPISRVGSNELRILQSKPTQFPENKNIFSQMDLPNVREDLPIVPKTRVSLETVHNNTKLLKEMNLPILMQVSKTLEDLPDSEIMPTFNTHCARLIAAIIVIDTQK